MSKQFSDDHRRAGELLRVMMKHRQIGQTEMAEILGIGRSTVVHYCSGQYLISYEMMNKFIAILDPPPTMKMNFQSSCAMAAIQSWKMAKKTRIKEK